MVIIILQHLLNELLLLWRFYFNISLLRLCKDSLLKLEKSMAVVVSLHQGIDVLVQVQNKVIIKISTVKKQLIQVIMVLTYFNQGLFKLFFHSFLFFHFFRIEFFIEQCWETIFLRTLKRVPLQSFNSFKLNKVVSKYPF